VRQLRPAAAVAALFLASCTAPVLGGRASPPAAERGADSCSSLLAEATAALAGAADTSAANVAAAHHRHAVKMAEYHACLSRDW